jgi:hypothetical protein
MQSRALNGRGTNLANTVKLRSCLTAISFTSMSLGSEIMFTLLEESVVRKKSEKKRSSKKKKKIRFAFV